MSNKKVRSALLEGHKPHFPAILTSSVQKRLGYHLERISNIFLDTVSLELWNGLPPEERDMLADVGPKKVLYWGAFTSDGYVAFAMVTFFYRNIEFRIIIPLQFDSERRNKTYADRHVALYAMGDASGETIRRAAVMFSKVFTAVYRRKYSGSIVESKRKKGIHTHK